MKDSLTAIPSWIGLTMITVFWAVMAGMVINAYVYYNVDTIEALVK